MNGVHLSASLFDQLRLCTSALLTHGQVYYPLPNTRIPFQSRTIEGMTSPLPLLDNGIKVLTKQTNTVTRLHSQWL